MLRPHRARRDGNASLAGRESRWAPTLTVQRGEAAVSVTAGTAAPAGRTRTWRGSHVRPLRIRLHILSDSCPPRPAPRHAGVTGRESSGRLGLAPLGPTRYLLGITA